MIKHVRLLQQGIDDPNVPFSPEERAESIVANLTERFKMGDSGEISKDSFGKLSAIIQRFQETRQKLIAKEETEEERGISIAECDFSIEFIGAIKATLAYIEKKKQEDPARKSMEAVSLGSEANIEFLKLFIDFSETYGMDEQGLLRIYHKVFSDHFLGDHLMEIGEQYIFSAGIYGVAKAFSYLQSKFPEAKFQGPTVNEDVHFKVDLRCETDDELSLFQIKGVTGAQETVMYDVLDEDERVVLENSVRRSEKIRGEKYILDIAVLVKHAQDLQKQYKERNSTKIVRAYWVQVEPVKKE